MSAILGILGPILQFAVKWFVARNTKEIVKNKQLQQGQENTDEIRRLIHQYHFGSTPQRRQEALEELRRRGAMT